VTRSSANDSIDAVWRIESPRLIAGLARLTGDVGLAEDLAQDALVAALEKWPQSGVPDNPGAWLMATAKHRAIDLFRRNERLARKQEELARDIGMQMAMDGSDLDAALDDEIGDDLLALIFTCCHPVLSTDARVALTLRLLGGLSTEEIARAFLAAEPTVAQRIVRAKRTLGAVRVPFAVPSGDELAERCRQCSRSSTWSSTRATRRPAATTGCDPISVRRPSASAASSPAWRRGSPRSTASSR
jgi:RNA polymerase sigma factor (sigma-70 family)